MRTSSHAAYPSAPQLPDEPLILTGIREAIALGRSAFRAGRLLFAARTSTPQHRA